MLRPVNLHGTTTVLALVAYSLKPVKLLGPCKRTQLCWPNTPTTRNNVVTCCVRLHGPLRSCFAVWLRNLSIAWQRILKFKNNFFNKCFMTHLTCKPAVLYWLHWILAALYGLQRPQRSRHLRDRPHNFILPKSAHKPFQICFYKQTLV